MPNLLAIPNKRSHPADIKTALRAYIHDKHPETHPDAFAEDISKWEASRKEAVANDIHSERIPAILAYHTQLVFASSKLPDDVGLPFSYDAMYTPGVQVALSSIAYERCCLLLNFASLHCHLAAGEDRSTAEGIKRAVIGFARAAGIISYILSNAIPPLQKNLEGKGISLPPEFDTATLTSFRFLMLAQGQECAWQRANMDSMKDGILAKLAAEASSLYRLSLDAIDQNPSIAGRIPKYWTSHIISKLNHFDAVAQYRCSRDDDVARRYGLEIGRLQIAAAAARRAVEAASKAGVARTVLDDAKKLESHLAQRLKETERHNDLIYQQDIPASSSTPSIQGTAIVREEIPSDLVSSGQPSTKKSGGGFMFAGLEGWGITRAVEIFNNRKEDWINDELVETQRELDHAATSSLGAMHLPASLDALSQPVGLPPSLLAHAEHIRREDGPNRLRQMFKDIKLLYDSDHQLTESIFDLLDQEAAQDEEIREAYGKYDQWERPASQDANKHLTDELQRNNRMLSQAKKTDKVARQKWDEWKEKIELLASDQRAIEEAVPKTTYSPREALTSTTRSATQTEASALRRLLEELDDLRIARERLLERARRVAATDDIKPRILRHASSASSGKTEQWADVDPAMFAGVIDQALGKYDEFRIDLDTNGEAQEELIGRIQEQNKKFLDSRKVDPSIKEREAALQTLDLAYLEYLNITRHLEEGIKFYNDFAEAVSKLKISAKEWVDERNASIK
ncbi:BRO1-domain-containing protein [Clavulina sp. PMI_390]|nr:BRO1-domain-containing protein [Clavulina sp. PMI_390]